jgi:DNA sulfur modification protein DndD
VLRIRKITLNNFGPFKSQQEIEFPQEPGVVVVYGENGRGKTSLLNAIRYAFFGKVLGRGSVQVAISKLGNWESAAEGSYQFGVELEFSHNEQIYQLNRLCKPAPGVTTPRGDGDYVQEAYLRRGGEALGPDQMVVELSRIMPEQVSRFFLFDGELLQEYEQLLLEESETGQKIKDSIERILGVPVLTGAKRNLDILLKEARETESKAAQKDKNTKALGEQLEYQMTLKKHQTEKLDETRKAIEKAREDKSRVDEQRRKFERVAKLINEEEELSKSIYSLGEMLKKYKGDLKGAAKNAWKTVLEPRVLEVRNRTERRIVDLQATSHKHTIQTLRDALKAKSCPVCSTALNEHHVETLTKHLEAQDKKKMEAEDRELQQLFSVIGPLRDFSQNGCRDIVNSLSGLIDELKIEMADKQHRLSDVSESIKGFDAKEIRELNIQSEHLVRDLALLDNQLDGLTKQLSEIDQSIQRIEDTLDKDAGAKLQNERARRELLSELLKLFDDGVHSYRERLRKRVEGDATTLFTKFSSDPDYTKLEINENYGLSIIHRDGQRIPIRSAGFEHIVALSLMGALQKNAPLSGPIIMDSPFGRLDGTHTKNVTRALPDMANQIMLLVYEEELEPKLARDVLAGKLRAEYKMTRVGARHSEIKKDLGD